MDMMNFGISKEEFKFLFDRKKIKENDLRIKYLYGQLLSRHQLHSVMYIEDCRKKYTGEIWTRNNGILAEFLMLGNVDNILFPFDETHTTELIFSFHKTISPYDPKYSDYIAEHREWIVPIKEKDDHIGER